MLALLELTEAAFNVLLSVVLARLYGSIGVALGTAIPLILMKLIVAPQVVCALTKTPLPAFYRAISPIILITIAYLAVYGYIAHTFLIRDSYLSVAITGALAVPLYALLAYRFFFHRTEIDLLRKLLPVKKG